MSDSESNTSMESDISSETEESVVISLREAVSQPSFLRTQQYLSDKYAPSDSSSCSESEEIVERTPPAQDSNW